MGITEARRGRRTPPWTPATAVVDALRIRDASMDGLLAVRGEDWDGLLDWCDRKQVTFLLREACGSALPARVRERMEQSLRRYTLRFERLLAELAAIMDVLDRRGLPFVVLKGITHSPAFTPDPILRAQGDIDLWIPGGRAHEARRALNQIGYVRAGSSNSDRHLPPMARASDWRWRGDVFDPEMPVRVELHHHLWRTESEHIPMPDESAFLTRLEWREIAGRQARVLCREDLLAFAALHLLLHLLHGDLPLQRAWEIARFLETHAADAEFWTALGAMHGPELRVIEAAILELVKAWFHCRAPRQELPPNVRLWLERFAFSPLSQSTKDELWLHLALIPTVHGKARVLLRRLFPTGGRHRSAARLRHHTATLLPAIVEGVRWFRACRANGGDHLAAPAIDVPMVLPFRASRLGNAGQVGGDGSDRAA
jgi:hypothetical protein